MVVTKGGEGADRLLEAAQRSVPAVPVTVVDTVGAGDTFNAGILASLRDQGLLTKQAIAALTEDQIRSVLTFSGKAAAITVSRAGANPPWRREMV